MSRFSKSEAEVRGWIFTHARTEREVPTSDSTVRTEPASYVAERYLSLPGQSATLIHEEGESIGKLLERISLFEAHLESKNAQTTVAPIDDSASGKTVSVDETGSLVQGEQAAATVLLPADPSDLSETPELVRVTDAAWSNRERVDSLIVRNEEGERESVTYGGAREDVREGLESRDRKEKAVEDRRAAEAAPGSVHQIEGDLVVRSEEDTIAEAVERKQILKKLAEDERTVAVEDQAFLAVAPEGAEALAGSDVSIQERSDLGSEIPRPGRVVDVLDEDGRDTGVESVSVEPQTAEELATATTAGEETAKEVRDDAETPEEADGPEAVQAVEDASAEAVQDHADDAETPESERAVTIPEHTEAAAKLAQEKGVKISDVEGSGKDGKVTKPDVEKHVQGA